jgi:hypothetical protein
MIKSLFTPFDQSQKLYRYVCGKYILAIDGIVIKKSFRNAPGLSALVIILAFMLLEFNYEFLGFSEGQRRISGR